MLGTWSETMNDEPLADLLTRLDEVLTRKSDAKGVAGEILAQVEARVPGTVMRYAAGIQLRSLGCRSMAEH